MQWSKKIIAAIFLCLFPALAFAELPLECYRIPGCRSGGASSFTPSGGGRVRVNPSAVPTDKGFGIEGIFFKDEVDLSIVRGTGRIGAAISPSNSEETFFGPLGFEYTPDFYERKYEKEKYPNQKITFASAFNLVDQRGSALTSYSLKMGIMAKYNKQTQGTNAGGGLSGNLGPLTFGGSIYKDETRLIDSNPYFPTPPFDYHYQVQTYNVGLFLNSLVIDYSHMEVRDTEVSTVQVLAATLAVYDFIFTWARRSEDSYKPYFNFETKALETQRVKYEGFGGIQYKLGKNFIIGGLYNYYLLHEYTLSATLFF